MTHPNSEEWMAYLYGECDATAQTALTAHLRRCPECRTRMDAWRATLYDLEGAQLPPQLSHWKPRRSWTDRIAPLGVAAMLLLGVGFGVGRWATPPPPPVDTDAIRREVAATVTASLKPVVQETVRHEVAGQMKPALVSLDDRLTQRVDTQLVPAVRRELAAAKPGLQEELSQQYRQEWARLSAETLQATDARTQAILAQFAQVYSTARAEDRAAMVNLLRQIESQRQSDYANLRQNLNLLATVTEDEFRRTQQEVAQLVAYSAPTPSRSQERTPK